jgi:hypothetical protein
VVLFGALVSMPLAPLRGVVWLAKKTGEEAEREYYNTGTISRQLDEVAQAREEGTIDDAAADALEESLVARLLEARHVIPHHVIDKEGDRDE